MTDTSKIHIGTSGWNYKHWRGAFYPDDIKADNWLEYYADRLNEVEINNSFYQLPTKKTFSQWRKIVPDGFSFSVKASRYITHMKKLKDPRDSVERLFEKIIYLEDKLGPILFQLPPRWKSNPDRLNKFLHSLPSQYKYTLQFRDQSWWNDDIYNILRKHNCAFCIYDLAGTQSPREVTSDDLIYIRLHGPEGAYQGKYSIQQLAAWAGAISSWSDQGQDVFVFFDNDQNGYAPKNALELKQMLS
jgi:uncharacterized protein YecE (DUF72 family)